MNRSATNITSKCRIASIELDDAMILPHAANLDQSNFREGQAYLSAAFSAPTWLFDLRSEPTRFKRRNISATIVADVK